MVRENGQAALFEGSGVLDRRKQPLLDSKPHLPCSQAITVL